jgi:hypothetical protein
MKFEEIISRLEALDLPTAQNQFADTKASPAPKAPYIVWIRTDAMRGPDCTPNMLVETNGAIELYTDQKFPAPEIERLIEKYVLPDWPYKKFQAPVPKENLFQTAYEFTILEKRRF